MAAVYEVAPDVSEKFKNFKKGKATQQRWATFVLKNDVHVFKDACTDMKKDVKDLCKSISESECSYIVYLHTFKTPDGRESDRLYFINWLPRAASNSEKMMYTTARNSIRKICEGCHDVQAGTKGDILDTILKTSEKDEDDADSDGGDDWMN